jgi:hypothetical protein
MPRVGEEFPLACPTCGGDIRLIAFITDPGPIRKILMHRGERLEPPPIAPARGPPTDWGALVQVHDDRDVSDGFQASPGELPVIPTHNVSPGRTHDIEAPGPAIRETACAERETRGPRPRFGNVVVLQAQPPPTAPPAPADRHRRLVNPALLVEAPLTVLSLRGRHER